MKMHKEYVFLRTSHPYGNNDYRISFLCIPGIEDSPDQLVGLHILSPQSYSCGQLPVAIGAKKRSGHTG